MPGQPLNKPASGPGFAQAAPKGAAPGLTQGQDLAALQGVSAHLAGLARAINLDVYAAAGYPGLRRSTPVSVYRPWSWAHPFSSRLAQLIRRYQARILEIPESECTEHHMMLYLGHGWCASQDQEMGLVHLKDYSGCRLTFWDWPSWLDSSNPKRDHLGMEMVVCKGEEYGYGDILGLGALAFTGSEKLLQLLADNEHMICSERLCHETREHFWSGFAGESTCLKAMPQWQAGWMHRVGFRPAVLEIN